MNPSTVAMATMAEQSSGHCSERRVVRVDLEVRRVRFMVLLQLTARGWVAPPPWARWWWENG